VSQAKAGWSDQRVEQLVGNLLRTGVLVAAAVVGVGGALYLWQHGTERANYAQFQSEPRELRNVGDIAAGVLTLDGKEVIQFGILLLVATPVARVALAAVAFALRRDWLYVAVTLFVLAILLSGLAGLQLG